MFRALMKPLLRLSGRLNNNINQFNGAFMVEICRNYSPKVVKKATKPKAKTGLSANPLKSSIHQIPSNNPIVKSSKPKVIPAKYVSNNTSLSATEAPYVTMDTPMLHESLLPKTIPWKDMQPIDVGKLILHEDDDIIVLYKPSTILSQADVNEGSYNLLDGVRNFLLERRAVKRKLSLFGKDAHRLSTRSAKTDVDSNSESKSNVSDAPVIGIGTEAGIELTPDIIAMRTPNMKPLTQYIGAINRLDRPCSGIIMYAKNAQAASKLCNAFAERLVSKEYLCMVNGFVNSSGNCHHLLEKTNAPRIAVMDAPQINLGASQGAMTAQLIENESTSSIKRPARGYRRDSIEGLVDDAPKAQLASFPDVSKSRDDDTGRFLEARMSFDVLTVTKKLPSISLSPMAEKGQRTTKESSLKAGDNKAEETPSQSLLRVKTFTGRKHQIRAQLSHIGFPVVGDTKYGAPQRFRNKEIALHAFALSIRHPITREKLHFAAPPPRFWTNRFGPDVHRQAIECVKERSAKQPVQQQEIDIGMVEEADHISTRNLGSEPTSTTRVPSSSKRNSSGSLRPVRPTAGRKPWEREKQPLGKLRFGAVFRQRARAPSPKLRNQHLRKKQAEK